MDDFQAGDWKAGIVDGLFACVQFAPAGAGKAVSEAVEGAAKLLGKAYDVADAAKGFGSFSDLKNALGAAGEGEAWHHIVEQSQIGKSGFAAEKIHNVNNVVAINKATHAKISGYYSSKQPFTEC